MLAEEVVPRTETSAHQRGSGCHNAACDKFESPGDRDSYYNCQLRATKSTESLNTLLSRLPDVVIPDPVFNPLPLQCLAASALPESVQQEIDRVLERYSLVDLESSNKSAAAAAGAGVHSRQQQLRKQSAMTDAGSGSFLAAADAEEAGVPDASVAQDDRGGGVVERDQETSGSASKVCVCVCVCVRFCDEIKSCKGHVD